MKKAYLAGAVLILGFLVLGLTTFNSSITPYVDFKEARSHGGTVQVMGALEKGTSTYDTSTKTLHFKILDTKTNDFLPVAYRDVKPANFEDALSVVAIGRYDGHAFVAEKLLVKCPSKYQGQEVEKKYGTKDRA
ncbi:MAG TPA: cytochrome c maturation protein CcmE [Thermoanaerobaculia bacterium]|jgi:cytochrome c-type biogenesis protein CcmE|nr:cytochrome c maturation protein CcmE [Thermoanaerobaculia bacterium]